MRFTKLAAVALVGLSAAFMACSEDTLTEDEFAEGLTDGGVDAAISECVAESVYGELGEDGASDAYDDEGTPTEEETALLQDAMVTCTGVGGEESTDDGTEEETGDEEVVDEEE